MTSFFIESVVEDVALEWLGDLAYNSVSGPALPSEESATERDNYDRVFLESRFRDARVPEQAIKPYLTTAADGKAYKLAKEHALSEFEKYRIVQDRLFESDFDRVVAETKRLAEKTDAPKTRKKKERKKP